MAAGIYKHGQGYWTRMMSGLGYGLLVVMGAVWLWNELKALDLGIQPVYVAATGALIFAAVFGLLGYVLIGRKPRTVDFLVATEGEMKKVNWSTKREIFGSTWVVIGLTIMIAILIFICDFLLFAPFFRRVGVLEG